MHELMVLSNAYRQATNETRQATIDPENKLVWRMNRRRLDAEALRDAVLTVTGKLTEQLTALRFVCPLSLKVLRQSLPNTSPTTSGRYIQTRTNTRDGASLRTDATCDCRCW